MINKSRKFHRRSMRLKGHNYASIGSYFVTLNCFERQRLFGRVSDRKMVLNELGLVAYHQWCKTPALRPNVELGPFIIMPDHVHGIINIKADNSQLNKKKKLQNVTFAPGALPLNSTIPQPLISPSQTLGAIIRGYMGAVTSEINQMRNSPGAKVWQRGYYDHIIRNKRSYNRISNYINCNPRKWKEEDHLTGTKTNDT